MARATTIPVVLPVSVIANAVAVGASGVPPAISVLPGPSEGRF